MFASGKNLYSCWGRLTAEPKFFAKTGTAEARLLFSIAVNEKNADPLFWDCVAWGNHAESLKTLLVKGKPVAVIGSIQAYTPPAVEGEPKKPEKRQINVIAVDFFPKDKFAEEEE